MIVLKGIVVIISTLMFLVYLMSPYEMGTDKLNKRDTAQEGQQSILKHDQLADDVVQELVSFFPAPEGIGGNGSLGAAMSQSGDTLILSSTSTLGHGVVYVYQLVDDSWQQTQVLTPSNPAASRRFGRAINISHNRILVADPYYESPDYGHNGVVYVYENINGSWQETHQISSGTFNGLDYYGLSLAQNENQIFVGSPWDLSLGNRGGGVYVYTYQNNNWVETQQLFNSNGNNRDRFGYSLALDGDQLLVGVPYDDSSDEDGGAVYNYVFNDGIWTFGEVIYSTDIKADEKFGLSVSLYGDYAVIGTGSEERDDLGQYINNGQVYIQKHDGEKWHAYQTISSEAVNDYDDFGYKVSIAGDQIVVTSPNNADATGRYGAIYFYQLIGTNWTLTDVIKDEYEQGAWYKGFGSNFLVSYDRLFIMDRGNSSNPQINAKVLEYKNSDTEWEHTYSFTEMGSAESLYASGVAISATHILIGAPGDSQLGKQSGAVYAYEFNGSDWQFLTKLFPTMGYPTAPNGELSYNDLNFGSSLAINGEYAAVSAPSFSRANAVYLYQFIDGIWDLDFIFNVASSDRVRFFGKSISFEGDLIAIGTDKVVDGDVVGAVYIYQNMEEGWEQVGLLESPSLEHDTFADDLDIYENNLLVGMPGHGQGPNHKGRAFLYSFDQEEWHLTHEFDAGVDSRGYYYGESVAYEDDVVMIGTHHEFEFSVGNHLGAVYVYEEFIGEWNLTQKLKIPLSETGTGFGGEIVMSENYAVIGRPENLNNIATGIGDGGAYLFTQTDGLWTFKENIKPTSNSKNFGSAISLDNDLVLIGSNLDNTNGFKSGAAILFELGIDYIIAGHVIGLMENNELTLSINDSEFLTINQIGHFEFSSIFESGESYLVKITDMKFPQQCVIANAYGSIPNNHIKNVKITCEGVIE